MNKGLVVITGATAGIGQALAKAFIKLEHPCLLLSRSTESRPKLENELALYRDVDVQDYQSFQAAIKEAEQRFGPTSCLVNNAGMINVGEFESLAIEKIHGEIDTMVKGVLNGIRIVLPGMKDNGSGTIINISSIGDRTPSEAAATYHACKHAVRSIGESLNKAEAKHNVRILNIAPGLIRTEIHKNMGISFEEYCENLGNPTFIQPAELADIILFCWQQPQHICIRDIVIMPTDCSF